MLNLEKLFRMGDIDVVGIILGQLYLVLTEKKSIVHSFSNGDILSQLEINVLIYFLDLPQLGCYMTISRDDTIATKIIIIGVVSKSASILILRFGFKFKRIITEFIHFKIIVFVFLIIKRFKFVNGKFVELIEILPPLISTAEFSTEICIGNIAAHCWSNIKSTHSKHIYTVAGNSTKGSRNTFDNSRMNMRTFTCGYMYSHAGSAKYKSSLKITLCDFRTYAKSYPVKHKVCIFIRIAIGSYTKIGNLPALFTQMCTNCLFERISCKVSTYNQIFVLYCFHNNFPFK